MRKAAWLACAAMLFAALAPSLSRLAVARAELALAMALCTVRAPGAVALDVASSRASEQAPAFVAGDVCPYCALNAHVPVLPRADGPTLAVPASFAVPARSDGEPPPSTAPPVSHPRGPPVPV